MNNILFAGYYGCGNLGDDAILLGYLNRLEQLKFPGYYKVLCAEPHEFRREYNLDGIARRDRKAVAEAILKCDALVFAGGSIFQDVTSFRSVAYYQDLVKQAKKAKKKVLLVGQGVGPVTRYFGKKLTVEAFMAADTVTVRDPASMTLLKSLGVDRPMTLTSDSAFLLPAPIERGEQDHYGLPGKTTIGLIPRPWGDAKKLAAVFADVCKILNSRDFSVTLFEMDSKLDGPFIDEIEKIAGGRFSHIKGAGNPIKIQQRLQRMEAVISMRLHGAILGASVGLPPTILSYDPKTTALAKLLDLPPALPIEGITADRIVSSFLEQFAKRDHHKKLMEKRLKELSVLADGNVQALIRTFPATAIL